MKNRVLVIILAAAVTAACNGTGNQTILPPVGTQVFQRVYVSDFVNPGTIHVFGPLPINSSSTQTASFSGSNEPVGMKFGASGNLYVANFGSFVSGKAGVQVFSQPIANGATPTFSITAPSGSIEDVAVDSAGNLYAASISNVRVYAAPLSGASTLSYAITNGTSGARGLSFDAGGLLYVNNGTNIVQYAPPFSSSSAPLITFGNDGSNHGIAFDTSGELFVVHSPNIDVYQPPFSNGQSKLFTIVNVAPAGHIIYYVAFDRNDNLYVPCDDGNLYVFNPPYSSGSSAAFHVSVGSLSIPGVAVGP